MNIASSVIPTMRYRDCHSAIQWLVSALGFTVKVVFDRPDGIVEHAELTLGSTGMIMLGSYDSGGELVPYTAHPDQIGLLQTHFTYLIVPDAEQTHRTATAAGAEMVLPLREMSYGGKAFTCRDPEGYLWSIGEYNPWA